jgi:hypothetical protein
VTAEADAHPLRPLALALALAALAGCASAAKTKPAPTNEREARRAQVEASIDPMKLQSGLLAFADTAVQRVGAGTQFEGRTYSPEQRQRMVMIRLSLSSALFGIVTGPDQVDALLDTLTHTALVAEAQRNFARDAPADGPEAVLRTALDRNEADAWTLAEQWLDRPLRDGLRAKIAALPLERDDPRQVAWVRLADLPRAGSAAIESGDGISDSLRAATQQADQVRLLAERSLYLMQRMPFLLRWQAQAYAYDTLALDETQRLLAQLGEMSQATSAAARTVAALPGMASKERAAALEDLFTRIHDEREAAIVQLAKAVRDERAATLDQVAELMEGQRTAALIDVESRGSRLIGGMLLFGALLIAILLGGLIGTLLLYRKLALRMERNPHG